VAKQTGYNVKGCDILGSLWEMLTYSMYANSHAPNDLQENAPSVTLARRLKF
jgi:hypothetical protein